MPLFAVCLSHSTRFRRCGCRSPEADERRMLAVRLAADPVCPTGAGALPPIPLGLAPSGRRAGSSPASAILMSRPNHFVEGGRRHGPSFERRGTAGRAGPGAEGSGTGQRVARLCPGDLGGFPRNQRSIAPRGACIEPGSRCRTTLAEAPAGRGEMARPVETTLIDDIDGGRADETVRFSWTVATTRSTWPA
jgi:hypothetical protein